MIDNEIKALLIQIFEAVDMSVGDIELRKNACGELAAILLIRPDDKASQKENENVISTRIAE